jgi:hypothetical protein
LREALRRSLEATRDYLLGEAEDRRDPLDRVESLMASAQKEIEHTNLGVSLKRRAARLKHTDARRPILDPETSDGGYLQSLIVQLLHIALTGEATDERGLEEVLELVGLGATARDTWTFETPNGPETVGPLTPVLIDDSLFNFLHSIQIDHLFDTVMTASLEELVAARDDFRRLMPVLGAAAEVLRFATDLPDAFGLGAAKPFLDHVKREIDGDLWIGRYSFLMLLVRKAVPSYTEGISVLTHDQEQFIAQAALGGKLPAGYGLNGLQRLREEAQAGSPLVRTWIEDNPREAAAAGVIPIVTTIDP